MPNRNDARDLLDVYVQLASARGAALPVDELRGRFGKTIDELIAVHAAQPGRPKATVTCTACLEGHAAEVIYDRQTRRSWIFCPQVGRVWLNDAELTTFELATGWLPDQLSLALSIAPRPPRLTLIENAAWLLGDMVVGSTDVSVALAVHIKTSAEIGSLMAGLNRRKLLNLGLLLVAGCELPEYVGVASGYATVELGELAALKDGSLQVDQARLGAWIRGLLQGRKRPIGTDGGRKARNEFVLEIFYERRRRGERYVSKSAEATAVLAEWPSIFPDEEGPGHSTVRKHLPEPEISERSPK